MKIKTKEQYDARYARRAPKQPRATHFLKKFDVESDEVGVCPTLQARLVSLWSVPNHAARAADLNEYYGSLFKAQKSPDFVKIPLMGSWQGCSHSLVLWREDEPDKYGKPVYFPVAMPCVVQHGWEPKVMYGQEQLVPAHGKPGEHGDKLGRVW